MELSSDHLKTATSVVTEMNTLIDPVHQNQPGAREGLLALSHQLTAMLETPSETIQRIGWAEPARFAAIRIAADLKIFDALKEAGGDSVNISQLASQTGAENSLIGIVIINRVFYLCLQKGLTAYFHTMRSPDDETPFCHEHCCRNRCRRLLLNTFF